MNAFDLIVTALKDKGLDSDEILEILGNLFRNLNNTVEFEIKEACSKKVEQNLSTEKKMEREVEKMLLEIGIPCQVTGFSYLVRAVVLYANNPGQKLHQDLYHSVAKDFGSTENRVERAIRHAIEWAYERRTDNKMGELFGNTIIYKNGKPTNKQLIVFLSRRLSK